MYVDVLERQPEFKMVLNSLRDAIASGLKIAIYGDYDADGFSSLLLWRDTFRGILYDNVVCYPFKKRMRTLDPGYVDFCRQEQVDYYLICDTGSSDSELLIALRQVGLTGIVLDHHECDNLPVGVKMLNSTVLAHDNGFEDVYCGASLSWLVARALLLSRGKNELISKLAVYALLAQYADVVEMNTDLGREIYRESQCATDIPEFISALANTTYLTKRVFEYSIAPKINAAFRCNVMLPLNNIVSGEPDLLFEAVNELASLQSYARTLVERVRSVSTILKYDEFVCIDIAPALQMMEYPIDVLLNYKGRVASAVADEFNKPCICICDNGSNYEGSFRSKFPKKYLDKFEIMTYVESCGGHSQAFGFVIDYLHWNNFIEELSEVLNELPNTLDEVEITDMLFGYDATLAYQLAYENEFRVNCPNVIKYNFLKLVETTKYGFAYLVATVDGVSLWCESTYRLFSGDGVFIVPYLYNGKIKFSIDWTLMLAK